MHMIKFDLHIHSSASQYKEDKDIVAKSTVENVDVLLTKLNDNGVSLFSITDHNRFNVELYTRLDEIMASDNYKYTNVQGLVAGVEFDVKIDEDMKKCHIICIFDTKNRVDNYEKIRESIKKDELTDPEDYYNKDRFEKLLRNIGLGVVLIACQRSSLDNSSGKHNSLSESASNPYELIGSGYISALEFQKPNVEGILKSNLKMAAIDSSLVMGSDCHEWSAYPMHDSSVPKVDFHHSKARILPTFKGLIMAFTSPKTRFNLSDNLNTNYIKSITVNGNTIELINGLNVLIGENGSGKSSLLKILNNQIKEEHVKNIKKFNQISCDSVDASMIRYIGQGDIVKKFDDNTLFKDSDYIEVDNLVFCNTYNKFKTDIYNLIISNIEFRQLMDSLNDSVLEYYDCSVKNYFIVIEPFKKHKAQENIHESKLEAIKSIIRDIRLLKEDVYYSQYITDIDLILEKFNAIEREILKKSNAIKVDSFLRNNILSAVNSYTAEIQEQSSALERTQINNIEKRNSFIDLVVKAMIKRSISKKFPKEPAILSGQSSKELEGFSFNCEAAYNNKNVIEEFYSKMFNKGYRDKDILSTIDSFEGFKDSIRSCTDINTIKEVYERNYNSFQDAMTVCKRYIVEGTKTNLGNTLGELSLAYLKYTIINDTCPIYLIDQPEDHISNLNISRKLITYFNSIRYKKQIIIVTHNPLLVVNQDADKVVFIAKEGDKIKVEAGSLEYESDEYNILELIAKNMDGGTDSIRKRLKVYE